MQVLRNVDSYNKTRPYRIDITADGGLSASTPTPRQFLVERLISQSRNATIDVKLNGGSVAAGGTMTLMVGQTYDITLVASTATNGYEQIESFINFPNTIFQVLAVNTTYSAETSATLNPPYDKLYGDACVWQNDPNSLAYNSCLSTGKAGGNVSVTYTVKIIGGSGTSNVLNTLIYDFSGSSYHYNSDFAVNFRVANIVSATVSKSFAPKTINPGGTSELTFTVNNPGPAAISNVNFTDTLPAGVTISGTSVTYNSCGSPSPSTLTNGQSALSFTNITVAAYGTCTIKVNVTASTANTYNNTTSNLFIGSDDTGSSGSDSLIVSSKPAPPPSCTTPTTMVTWTMPTSGQGSGGPPPPYTTRHADVSSSSTSAALTAAGTQSIVAAGTGGTTNAWRITGAWKDTPGAPAATAAPYFQFTVDSSNFGGVRIAFQYDLETSGEWASNVNNYIYVYSSTDGSTWSLVSTTNVTKGAWQPAITANAAASGTSTTYFRITAVQRGNQATASVLLDNVTISGCPRPTVPTLSKTFSASSIPLYSASTLTFTVSNPNSTSLTGVSFDDLLPSGLEINDPANLATTCSAGSITGGTLTGSPGGSTINLYLATLSANAVCTITISVKGISAGSFTNVSGNISADGTGANTGPTGYGTASITVVAPPIINKTFGATSVFTGNNTALTFSISNPNAVSTLTGVAFTDSLPAGLVVATPNGISGSCGGGTISAVAGSSTISLSGASLSPGATCTFSVNVNGSTAGLKENSTQVTSTNGGTGNTSTANLLVKDPAVFDPPYGYKTVNDSGWPELVWVQVWINNSNATALGVIITDDIPLDTTYIVGSLVCETPGTSTITRCDYDPATDQIIVEADIDPDPGALTEADADNEIIITFRTTVADGILMVRNQAQAFWDEDDDGNIDAADANVSNNTPVVTDDPATADPDDPTIALAPGVTLDDLRNREDQLAAEILPEVGYPPEGGRSIRPAFESPYEELAIRITIPRLGQSLQIVSVPLVDGNWEVSWLGNQAGYLEGTAFPTFTGNTALAGHVWDANNNPGPFYGLEDLQYGDQIIINAWGSVYVYEVQENSLVKPDDLSVLEHSNYDIITLITCEGFNAFSGEYANRRVVVAILVAVR